MQALEETIATYLRQWGLKLAVAESCTGGLLADRLTDLPGSSDYFLGGVVAYSNETKAILLGVSRKTLRQHGAVSRETVIEMARGARKILGADLALSISGIAGPGGGLPEKPLATPGLACLRRRAPGLVISSGRETGAPTNRLPLRPPCNSCSIICKNQHEPRRCSHLCRCGMARTAANSGGSAPPSVCHSLWRGF